MRTPTVLSRRDNRATAAFKPSWLRCPTSDSRFLASLLLATILVLITLLVRVNYSEQSLVEAERNVIKGTGDKLREEGLSHFCVWELLKCLGNDLTEE